MIDPGSMFGSNPPAIEEVRLPDAETSKCSAAPGVILGRLVRKLFNQMDQLQPSELDTDDFNYQSSLTYDNYLEMMHYLDSKQLNCANLHKIDSLLSGFIEASQITRPSQGAGFYNFIPFNPSVDSIRQWPNAYMLAVIFSVCLLTWLIKNLIRCGQWRSILISLGIVGFIEFFMHQHFQSITNQQEKLEKCLTPSRWATFLSYLGYDYNGCATKPHSSNQPDTNVAILFCQFLAELLFRPLIPLARSAGIASQNYLNSFTTLNQILLGPVFLAIIHIGLFATVCAAFYYHRTSSATRRRPALSPRRSERLPSSSSK